MNWTSLDQFLSMGGAAWYVWGSYGVTVLAFVIEILWIRGRRRLALAAARAVRPASAANLEPE